jgi:hypothetical protein
MPGTLRIAGMLAHELVAIAVGQNNIAYQHIKRQRIGRRCISSLSQTR